MNHILFSYSTVDGHLDHSQYFSVMDFKTPFKSLCGGLGCMNMFIFLLSKYLSGIAESYDNKFCM